MLIKWVAGEVLVAIDGKRIIAIFMEPVFRTLKLLKKVKVMDIVEVGYSFSLHLRLFKYYYTNHPVSDRKVGFFEYLHSTGSITWYPYRRAKIEQLYMKYVYKNQGTWCQEFVSKGFKVFLVQ